MRPFLAGAAFAVALIVVLPIALTAADALLGNLAKR